LEEELISETKDTSEDLAKLRKGQKYPKTFLKNPSNHQTKPKVPNNPKSICLQFWKKSTAP
jgi:hypothetical protein